MLLSGSSFSWPYLPSMWHTGALWRQLATTTWSTPSQPFYNGSSIPSIPTSSSSVGNDTTSNCFNTTSANSVIDPLLGSSGLFNSSSSSSPSATFATSNPSFYANCYAALSASTFSSTMGSSNMMNGMNFFNLNATSTPPSLFGSSTGTSSAYKESCKYVSPHDDDEIENDDDNERLLGGSSNHLNKSNSNNTSSYNERNNERTSHVTGEENTN